MLQTVCLPSVPVRVRRLGSVALFGVSVLLTGTPLHASTGSEGFNEMILACDRWADPDDPEARTDGVDRSELQRHAAQARTDCERAVDAVNPSSTHARLFYQLGRAYSELDNDAGALIQFQRASELGHAGATTQVIVHAILNGVNDAYTLTDFASYLSDAVAVGYQPAGELYLMIMEVLEGQAAPTEVFDVNLFYGVEITQAVYSGNFDALAEWRTDELLIDHLGIQGSLLLYVTGWEESISQLWICPTLARPAIAAAVKRMESEGLLDRFLDEPKQVMVDAKALFMQIVTPKAEEATGLKERLRRIGEAFARHREQVDALQSQGRKDALLLKQHYGCDSDVSHRIANNLAQFFKDAAFLTKRVAR